MSFRRGRGRSRSRARVRGRRGGSKRKRYLLSRGGIRL